jgi:hypothetical protein
MSSRVWSRQRSFGSPRWCDRLFAIALHARCPTRNCWRSGSKTYGVDSDFVRVRVRGLPPTADELQFIDRERIKEAQEREPQSLDDDPLICGVDVSGGGTAWNVAAIRRSGDARSIPRIRIPGEHTRDRNVLVGRLAEILKDKRPGRVVAAMFLDMAFGSPIYERLRALEHSNVFEVNSDSPTRRTAPRPTCGPICGAR